MSTTAVRKASHSTCTSTRVDCGMSSTERPETHHTWDASEELSTVDAPSCNDTTPMEVQEVDGMLLEQKKSRASAAIVIVSDDDDETTHDGNNKVVHTVGSISLTAQDMALLRPRQWLNDQVCSVRCPELLFSVRLVNAVVETRSVIHNMRVHLSVMNSNRSHRKMRNIGPICTF